MAVNTTTTSTTPLVPQSHSGFNDTAEDNCCSRVTNHIKALPDCCQTCNSTSDNSRSENCSWGRYGVCSLGCLSGGVVEGLAIKGCLATTSPLILNFGLGALGCLLMGASPCLLQDRSEPH
jgi:hypothetical protein